MEKRGGWWERLRGRYGWKAAVFSGLYLLWELVDHWGNIVFVTDSGSWAWLPETTTMTPYLRFIAILAALFLIGSYLHDSGVIGRRPSLVPVDPNLPLARIRTIDVPQDSPLPTVPSQARPSRSVNPQLSRLLNDDLTEGQALLGATSPTGDATWKVTRGVPVDEGYEIWRSAVADHLSEYPKMRSLFLAQPDGTVLTPFGPDLFLTRFEKLHKRIAWRVDHLAQVIRHLDDGVVPT